MTSFGCNLWLITAIGLGLAVLGSLADQKSFDCKMRQLGMEFAQKIQPSLSKVKLQEIADALNGAEEAQNCSVTVPDVLEEDGRKAPTFSLPNSEVSSSFYVDAKKGSDSNSGTMDSPFMTINKAVMAARDAGEYSTIILREGTLYLTETVELTSKDKGLTIQNYPNEVAWVSGGKVIMPKWEKYDVDSSKKTNIYKADLSSENIATIPGLRVNMKRAIRARYPNADPELGFGSSLSADKWLPPTLPSQPDTEVNPDTPMRNSSDSFQQYQLGIGGPCKNFEPPAGYWCGSKTSGGGAFTYRVPSGMVADKNKLPNSPYKNPKGAVIQTWRPAHWASWMYEVGLSLIHI